MTAYISRRDEGGREEGRDRRNRMRDLLAYCLLAFLSLRVSALLSCHILTLSLLIFIMFLLCSALR
jgi:hypothetical protein